MGKCVICLDVMNGSQICTLACGHMFHTTCLAKWFFVNQACPLCRSTAITCCHYQYEEGINAYLLAHGISKWAIDVILNELYNEKKKYISAIRENVEIWFRLFLTRPPFASNIEKINVHKNDPESLIEHQIWLNKMLHESEITNQALRNLLLSDS